MKKQCDAADKILKEKNDAIMAEQRKISGFKKLWVFNVPQYYIFIGLFFAAMAGSSMPVFGWSFGNLLNIMTLPDSFLSIIAKGEGEDDGLSYLMSEVKKYSLVMALVSFAAATLIGGPVALIGAGRVAGLARMTVSLAMRRQLTTTLGLSALGCLGAVGAGMVPPPEAISLAWLNDLFH